MALRRIAIALLVLPAVVCVLAFFLATQVADVLICGDDDGTH